MQTRIIVKNVMIEQASMSVYKETREKMQINIRLEYVEQHRNANDECKLKSFVSRGTDVILHFVFLFGEVWPNFGMRQFS